MTERNLAGDAVRSSFRRAQKLAGDKGLTAEEMDVIAAGVREFDEQRSTDHRTVHALEKIAANTKPPKSDGDPWSYEERRLRRREVYAQELLAVAMLADDVADENLVAIRSSERFKALIDRLKTGRPTDGLTFVS